MLYYGNLSQEHDHVVDSAFDDSHLPRAALSPSIFSQPGNRGGGVGAVPPVVLQLDRENKVLQMADVFLAHYENVRFLNLLSLNSEVLGDINEVLMPHGSVQTPHTMRSPSPVVFSPRTKSSEDQLKAVEKNHSGTPCIAPPNVDSPASVSVPPFVNSIFQMQFSASESDCNTSVLSSLVLSPALSDGRVISRAEPDPDSGVLFSDHQLDCAKFPGNMGAHSPFWLVSKRDAPQDLLPMPLSVPALPPEWMTDQQSVGSSLGISPLRGSEEWAPPRFQIILTLQPQKPVAQVAERQRYKCRGCGHLVDKRVLKSLRYCHYYGSYFCTQCHTGQKSILPAAVILNWDFNPYHVSEQAADLLVGIANEPYFFVAMINAALFKKHRCLRDAQKFRLQLAYLSDYIKQCKEAKREQQIIENPKSCPPHWCEQANPSAYSIADLIGIREKKLLKRWGDLINSLKKHVISCQTCVGRGYVCEGCWRRDDVIFPFNVDNVVVCPACRFSFHRQCHPNPENPQQCPRCCRLETRRQQQRQKQAQLSHSINESDSQKRPQMST